jgi:hypothetical protein
MSAFLVAAALAVSLAAAHSYLGERCVIIRLLRRADLPKLFGSTEFTKRTLRFAWHLTSVAWLGFGALLAMLAVAGAGTRQAEARVISGTFALSGIVALVGSRGRHVSWVFFFAIAALVWFGYP